MAAALLLTATGIRAEPTATDLAGEAVAECKQGRDATAREVRKRHFEQGQSLAERAVALDDGSIDAHFGLFCNMGELMRLDGEKISSVFQLRRLMAELDRTLQLDPHHVEALATKGTLLLRLPRVFGGNPSEGEKMLREVVRLDDTAVGSRITLAKTCEARGERAEAVAFATRALQIARQQGRADKVAEAQATLDGLRASR